MCFLTFKFAFAVCYTVAKEQRALHGREFLGSRLQTANQFKETQQAREENWGEKQIRKGSKQAKEESDGAREMTQW